MFGQLRLLQGVGKMGSPDYHRGSFFPSLSPFIGLGRLKKLTLRVQDWSQCCWFSDLNEVQNWTSSISTKR